MILDIGRAAPWDISGLMTSILLGVYAGMLVLYLSQARDTAQVELRPSNMHKRPLLRRLRSWNMDESRRKLFKIAVLSLVMVFLTLIASLCFAANYIRFAFSFLRSRRVTC